jgi:hypothetical protein
MPWMILGIVVALALAGLVAQRARYDGRLFSDAHFREVYDKFVPALGSGRAFVTSAGLAIAVTRTEADDHRRVPHVSLSQASGYTTAAVAGRFGFFLVAILNRNKMNLDPFFTRSRVHHLVFASPAAPLEINDFDYVIQQYRRGYRPLPYALHAIE